MTVQQEAQLTSGTSVFPSPSQDCGYGKEKPSQQKPNSGRFCTHCNLANHNVDTCFIKHGYPPHYKFMWAANGVQFDQSSNSVV